MTFKTMPALMFFLFSITITEAQENKPADSVKVAPGRLLEMSFEDLMNVRVVTPTRNLQSSKQAPATVLVVTMDQIRLRGYRNLGEVLNDLPDFIVNNNSDPQFYNTVSIRGIFRQDHFVILLDGIRISSPTNEPLPLLENFPIYLARQIEIVYGPGSALYGADAMAGVINIITQTPADSKDVTLTAMGGTQGYSNTTALFNKKLKNGLKISMGGQYSYDAQPDFSRIYKDEYDMTSQETGLFNTSFGPASPQRSISPEYEAPIKAYNAYASIDKDGFSMKILHHYAQVPASTTLRPNNAVYNKDVFYGQGVTTGSGSYTITSGKLNAVSTIVGSFYKVNPRSNFRNLYGGIEPGYKYSTGSMIKVEEQINYTFSKKINLTGGLTYELFHSIPKSPELQSPVNKKGSIGGILLNSTSADNPSGIEARFFPLIYTNVGSYLQGQYFPVDKLSFTAGVRYDNNSRFGSTVNPRIGTVFNPFKGTTLKVLYGTAFWAPSPMVSFESYGSFYTQDSGNTYQSTYWHLPNPDLKPMKSKTVELSIQQKIGKKFSATLTAYRSMIDDLIVAVPDNGNTDLYNNKFSGWDVAYIEVPFNRGSQQNYGGNFVINSTFRIRKLKLNAWSSLSYSQGKISNGGAPDDAEEVEQAVITPWLFRAGLDGRFNDFHFSVRLIRSGRQRMTTFLNASAPDKRQTMDGYALLNMSAGYTFNKTTFFLKIDNALDERYQTALAWDTSINDDTFNGGYQNPLRAMVGIRLVL